MLLRTPFIHAGVFESEIVRGSIQRGLPVPVEFIFVDVDDVYDAIIYKFQIAVGYEHL